MKIDTFVDFFSTWINLPRQKIVWKYFIVQYIKSISHLLKNYPPTLRYPAKILSENVLLSNNSIWDMSCFLRASFLLYKEKSGTVNMANKYKLASILTIYINHSTRTEEADTIRMVYSMVVPEYMIKSYKESQN